MAVFVDDMRAYFGSTIMRHMGADTTEELREMADRIGVARPWVQQVGTRYEHFDICPRPKGGLSVQCGAIEVSQRDFVLRIREKEKKRTESTKPGRKTERKGRNREEQNNEM